MQMYVKQCAIYQRVAVAINVSGHESEKLVNPWVVQFGFLFFLNILVVYVILFGSV
jgi:hypothetical protein